MMDDKCQVCCLIFMQEHAKVNGDQWEPEHYTTPHVAVSITRSFPCQPSEVHHKRCSDPPESVLSTFVILTPWV